MFNILDYENQLQEVKKHGTWIFATCPVCNGKLKISTNPNKYGAYACYSNECHIYPNKIRQLLYKPSPFTVPGNNSPFSTKKLTTIVNQKDISCSAKDLFTTEKYVKPLQYKADNKLITIYNYEGFRITRLDYIREGKREKIVYPEYLADGEYVRGNPDQFEQLPIYKNTHLQTNIVFTEGEKCAAIGQKLGLAAITFPSFVYSERYIERFIRKMVLDGVENVLYLRDNDEKGLKKANLVCSYFWKYNVGARIVNLAEKVNKKDKTGYDLYDAYVDRLVWEENVREVLKNLC